MNNRFFGSWSKLLTMNQTLNMEIQEKYYNDYQAYYKARLEIGSAPVCFEQCVNDVNSGAGLNSDEKNCMRECYMKRVSSRDDFNMLITQKLARETMKGVREESV